MPISLDLPMIDTVIVEGANPGYPFGACGVGGVPIVPSLAVPAKALYRATGARKERLPMNPAAVMETVWKSNGR